MAGGVPGAGTNIQTAEKKEEFACSDADKRWSLAYKARTPNAAFDIYERAFWVGSRHIAFINVPGFVDNT